MSHYLSDFGFKLVREIERESILYRSDTKGDTLEPFGVIVLFECEGVEI